MISLSRSGFAALGIPEECQPADPVFQSGARYGQDDPMIGWGYSASPPGLDDHLAPGADALIILAHNDEAKLNAAWQDLCAEIEGFADVACDADLEGGRPEPGHLLWMGAETGEEMHRGVKPGGKPVGAHLRKLVETTNLKGSTGLLLAEAVAGALKEYGAFKISPVEDPLYAGAEGALALAQDMPEEYWEDM